MKVFVTGIAGFLGSHVAERFRDLGWTVAGIDNLTGGSPSNVPKGVELIVADCLDRDSYAQHLAGSDLLYHCACAAYEGLSVFSPSYVYKNTVQATVEVATAAAAAGVPRFAYCSSMARYGNLQAPFREDMAPNPVNPYGLAKHASELIVKNILDMHDGDYAIAIPHSIIGPRQRYDDPYRNVASIMINRMLKGQQPIIYGDGSQSRCFSFVSELLNFDLDPIFVPNRPFEVKAATCSAEKARRLLGYKTAVDLRSGLQTMIDWIDRQGAAEFRYNREIEILTPSTPSTWVDKLI